MARIQKILRSYTLTKLYLGREIGWITQLVVDAAHRRKLIATNLLRCIERSSLFKGVAILGVASSHPATCHILAKLVRT